jgi:hypothetical protein
MDDYWWSLDLNGAFQLDVIVSFWFDSGSLSFLPVLFDGLFRIFLGGTFGVHNKLVNFLRCSNDLIVDSTIIHLADHNFELCDAALINFAKIINKFDYVKSSKSCDGRRVFSLDDCVIVYAIIPEEGTVREV